MATDGDASGVAAFAAQLGIDQPELMWIAEVGISSPLPPRWDAHCDDTGFVYYVNRDRQESTWENPLCPYLKQVVWLATQWLTNPNAEWLNEQISTLWNGFKDELETWHGPYEEDGRLYYINSDNGISSWEDPRVDAQYLFELQCGLLAKVQQTGVEYHVDTPVFGEDANGAPVIHHAAGFNLENIPSIHAVPAGSSQNRVPSTAVPAAMPRPEEGEHSGSLSLQDLRKKLTEKLAQVDPEQANREHQMVATSMRNQLRRVYDFLQNERDSYDIQLQRKRKERQRRIVRQRENVPPAASSSVPGRGLTVDPSAQKVAVRKFKRIAFSGMSLEEVKGPAIQSPKNSPGKVPAPNFDCLAPNQ